MKLDNYVKIEEWFDSSIGQLTVIQQLDKKRSKLLNQNQTQNRRRYINFENGSHFICSFNLNNPETTVCIAFITGCIEEIIGFYRSLTDKETSHIHKYLMKKWSVIADPI